MEKEKNQKIVVLTGASRGIGHATVKKFASENWRVITCSRQTFDERCPWPGGKMNHIKLDLSLLSQHFFHEKRNSEEHIHHQLAYTNVFSSLKDVSKRFRKTCLFHLEDNSVIPQKQKLD